MVKKEKNQWAAVVWPKCPVEVRAQRKMGRLSEMIERQQQEIERGISAQIEVRN